jgi:hypothetical protein
LYYKLVFKKENAMDDAKLDVQKALNDIAIIRGVLDKASRDSSDSKLVGETLDANLLLQTIAFIATLALCLVEAFSGNSMTGTLISTRHFVELQTFGIGFMGFILAGLLITLYFILWRAARNSGEELNTYIGRNFRYIKNLSLMSDLLMKFITIALLLFAGKAEWIAPVLLVFTGDYLLQGRFFTFPTKASVVLGLACVAAGFAQFVLGVPSLFFPLATFALLAGMSAARLAIRYKQQASFAA